jgi:hypothetical protein
LGSFASGWVVDNFGAQNGFWVSVAAAATAFLTIALGQAALGGVRRQSAPKAVPMLAE